LQQILKIPLEGLVVINGGTGGSLQNLSINQSAPNNSLTTFNNNLTFGEGNNNSSSNNYGSKRKINAFEYADDNEEDSNMFIDEVECYDFETNSYNSDSCDYYSDEDSIISVIDLRDDSDRKAQLHSLLRWEAAQQGRPFISDDDESEDDCEKNYRSGKSSKISVEKVEQFLTSNQRANKI
jgi:hypothetical protein